LIASAAKLHTEPAQPSKMQHACLNETVSHQKKNATKRPIDLPHLPIATKTEQSAADLPPTLLCKLLNIKKFTYKTKQNNTRVIKSSISDRQTLVEAFIGICENVA
jgi:hypothetical protein